MASVIKFITVSTDYQEKIKQRCDGAESIRREHFVAARKIQAWFRGIITRNHLRLLHEYAITIQRHWRGHRDRIAAEQYLVQRVHEMWQVYYDRMATRIQAIWRGYWARKTVLDIPKMRRWLRSVYTKNEETVEKMKNFRKNEIKHTELAIERESMHWILFILFKLHHLLRTHRQAGVITRLDRTRFTFIEEMLKCLGYRHYRNKWVACKECQLDRKPSLILRGTHYERCEREIREIEKSLEAGTVPVFRSEPYDKQEKIIRELNKIYQVAALHSRFEAFGSSNVGTRQDKKARCRVPSKKVSSKKTCCFMDPNLKDPCIGTDDLYKEIQKMECHLDDLRMKCPVHDVPTTIS